MPDVAWENRDHPPKRLMGYYDNRQTPLFLATNGKRPVHLTYDFSLRHPRDFWQKPPGLSPYARPLANKLLSIWQTGEKLHTSKVKHTQTKQSKRRENRYQTHNNESHNEYSHIQSIFTGYAKITRYSMSKKQGMNNNSIQNTVNENLSKGISSAS